MDQTIIKEFREKGYLQEANRKFFHPLGLALEIKINENGIEELGGIWDYRDDEEGIFYNIKESSIERKTAFLEKEKFISGEFKKRSEIRKNKLGFGIEPI